MGRNNAFCILLVWCICIQALVSHAWPNQHIAKEEILIEKLRRILHLETDDKGKGEESIDGGTPNESNGYIEDYPKEGQTEEREENIDESESNREYMRPPNEVQTLHVNDDEIEETDENKSIRRTNQGGSENEDDDRNQYKKEETDSSGTVQIHVSSETRDGGKMVDEFLFQMLSGGEVDPDNQIAYVIESSDSEHDELTEFKDKINNKEEIEKLALHNAKNKGDEKDIHKIIIGDEQMVERGLKTVYDGEVAKRNFPQKGGFIRLWPNGVVPYEIEGELQDPKSEAVIEKAVQEMSDLTCVKFVKRGSPEASSIGHTHYVSFVNESGCWSYVGYISRENQKISLGRGCVTVSTALHEMCHAIGQEHEQSRSDRDGYVTILWNNLYDTNNRNFAKQKTLDNNPYDHESVLQYGLKAGTKNGEPTMEFHDRRLDFLADYGRGLTFYDVQDILDAYKCADHCTNPPQCQNAGVVNHRCQCYCPSGLTGTLCEKTTTNSVCSKDIIDLIDGVPQTILSPKTDEDLYPVNVKCVWFVRAPTDRRIKLTINELELSDTIRIRNGKQVRACYHWLEVQYNLIGQSGPKECGKITQKTFITTGDGYPNLMMLKFDSEFSSDKPAKKGFHLTVETIGLGCSQKPCKFGTCTEDSLGGYKCTCNLGWTGIDCDTPTASTIFLCTFEDSTQCVMSNVNDDDFDWTVHKGTTRSTGTGPDSAQEGAYYIYMEASYINTGDIARLETTFSLPAVDRCLTFWYNMYGGQVGRLSVYTTSSSNSTRQNLWSKTGNQGKTWRTAKVDIKADNGQKIGFEAARGNSWKGDIALDTLELRPGSCSQTQTDQPLTTKTPLTSTRNPTTTRSPSTTTHRPTATQTPPTTTRKPTTTQSPPTTTRLPTIATTTKLPPSSFAPVSTTAAPNPIVGNILFSCNFEPDEYCFLQDVLYDDFSWTLNQGPTRSSNTGPDGAYNGMYYKYIETSRRKGQGDVAILESDLLPERSMTLAWQREVLRTYDTDGKMEMITDKTSEQRLKDMCLQFHYHMYGTRVGDLTLLIEKIGESPFEEWSESGNLGKAWNYVEIDLHQLPDLFLILFMAKQGRSTAGDIAIDDIRIRDGLCEPLILPASCTFEPGADCFLRNFKYDFDWRINKGATRSRKTGPSGAAEGLYYKYIETSSPNQRDDEAWLGSKELPSGTNMCIRFKYNMYGDGVGELKIEHEVDGMFRTLWSWSNDNGDKWFQIAVDVPYYDKPSRIYFVGVQGRNFRGDIAIDDIHIDQGFCPRHPSSGTHCSFSPDEFPCFLDNVDYDDFDWTFSDRMTPSAGTGPSSLYDGFYAYIEASRPRKYGDQAVLSSEHTNVPEGYLCLEFMYSMNGNRILSLMVLSGEYMNEDMRWSMEGDQGDVWNMARVSIPAVGYNQTIKIVGIRGRNHRGDIAIDDVTLTPDLCD